ncbi:hypothetical protein EX30DRAFT_367212 [Ascodesmis nigricans]|uniref:Retrotransposon gag domain-containing protein n=1 Tax=Ascodesmis nigricans TaxID=341454 RepID=A0A4S2MQP0_9PEZI|nr:hypothetical protein EX30DRAFT_367212 [Ascodesmis nigricans]
MVKKKENTPKEPTGTESSTWKTILDSLRRGAAETIPDSLAPAEREKKVRRKHTAYRSQHGRKLRRRTTSKHRHDHLHIHVHLSKTSHSQPSAADLHGQPLAVTSHGRRLQAMPHGGHSHTEMSNNQTTESATGSGLAIPADQVQARLETMRATAEMNRPVIPQPSTAGALYFNGDNVMKFLKSFERMVKTYGAKQPIDNFVEEVSHYCVDDIVEEVRLLNGYAENNWKVFCESMETRYALRDSEQAKYSFSYLRTAAEEHKPVVLTMWNYYTRYSVAVRKMKKKRLITDRELVTLFISGLGKEQ